MSGHNDLGIFRALPLHPSRDARAYTSVNALGGRLPNAAANSSVGKKKVDSCSGYRPEIPEKRTAAGGEGASGGASRLDLGGKRRSLHGGSCITFGRWGIGSVRDDVILAHSAALLLSGPAAACTNQSQASNETRSAFAWARARPRDTAPLSKLQQAPSRRHGVAAIFSPRPAFNNVIASRCGDWPRPNVTDAPCNSC